MRMLQNRMLNACILASAFAALCVLCFAAVAAADVVVDQPVVSADETVGTPGSGFVPAPEGEGEHINGGALMLVAYGVFWVLMLGYVAVLAARARRDGVEMSVLKRQVTDLEDRLDEIEQGS